MRLLLDTHIWLWGLLEPKKLSRRVRQALESVYEDAEKAVMRSLQTRTIKDLLIVVNRNSGSSQD